MGKKKSNKNSNDIEEISFQDDVEYEENGICEFPVAGTPIAQFSFVDNSIPSNEPMIKELKENKTAILSSTTNTPNTELATNKIIDFKDNISLKSNSNGITPPIDGEYFVTRRTFIFRKSTIRLLNELKAAHSDENVYLSTIVDEALCHYHDYIFNKNAPQSRKNID